MLYQGFPTSSAQEILSGTQERLWTQDQNKKKNSSPLFFGKYCRGHCNWSRACNAIGHFRVFFERKFTYFAWFHFQNRQITTKFCTWLTNRRKSSQKNLTALGNLLPGNIMMPYKTMEILTSSADSPRQCSGAGLGYYFSRLPYLSVACLVGADGLKTRLLCAACGSRVVFCSGLFRWVKTSNYRKKFEINWCSNETHFYTKKTFW